MHRYLRSIGFSEFSKNNEIKKLIRKVIRFADIKTYVSGDNETIWAEYRKEFASGMGISVCGEYTEDNEFEYEYYFPYYSALNVSSNEEITIEKHTYNDSYSGVCDEYKVGISLIFFLQNKMDYLKETMRRIPNINPGTVSLTGMSDSGMIVLPLNKNEDQIRRVEKKTITRTKLMEKAKAGDEKAIESLTLEDMDKFNMVSQKIQKNDVFSLVDTYFMPYGTECDLYSVMGEIEESKIVVNKLTKEEIYIISMKCNDINLEVCINKKDLMGEPAPKRRFKGVIWLQGNVSFQ